MLNRGNSGKHRLGVHSCVEDRNVRSIQNYVGHLTGFYFFSLKFLLRKVPGGS